MTTVFDRIKLMGFISILLITSFVFSLNGRALSSDVTPPELIKVEAENVVVNENDSFRVYVFAKDDTGIFTETILSEVCIARQTNAGEERKYQEIKLNDTEEVGKYYAEFIVNENWTAGKYNIEFVTLTDLNKNHKTYYRRDANNNISNAVFYVGVMPEEPTPAEPEEPTPTEPEEPTPTEPIPEQPDSEKNPYEGLPDGLNQIDGEWVYIRNNEIATDFNGLVKHDKDYWYIENGKANFEYTGLVNSKEIDNYDTNWYWVTNGVFAKYDGIRLQVHRNGNEINIFTRRLENITHALPEIVELFDEYLPHENYIVEGEVIATRDGKPLPFQNILHRVRRKHNVEEAMENVPLKLYLFDVLFYKVPMIDEPLKTRRATLESIVDTSVDAMNLSTMKVGTPDNIGELQELFESSIEGGHEGIMIKDASEPYIPGLRGKKMLKYKAEPETLDMIVIGGTYGIGKRGDFVGSYLVALRDENDDFKSVAYAATGLDDATLEYLTGKMKELEISTKGREIIVEPKIVLEIAFSEIVESPEYETGYSLRFPVVKNIRKDKGPMDVDTVERLISMYNTGN